MNLIYNKKMEKLTKLQEKIKANNALYSKASRKEKRRLIIQDSLNYLNSRKIEVCASNGYVESCDFISQETLIKGQVSCTVCARGLMLLSKVKLANKVSFGPESVILQENTADVLKEAFTKSELAIIENIFEQSGINCSDVDIIDVENQLYDNGYTDDSWEEFSEKHYPNNDRARLRVILKNILEADCNVKKGLIDKYLTKKTNAKSKNLASV
jgi:hypothetical protein